MEVRVLGPLELAGPEGVVAVPARKQQRLLAALVIDAGSARSVDALIESVWDERPPASARKLLQVYVSQLRKVLPPPAAIRTHGVGYMLELPGDALDSDRFERLLREGQEALAAGNAELALSRFMRALDLWRGEAYGVLAYAAFAREEAERLAELRAVCLEERFEAELALGRAADVLPDLRAFAALHPLRERTRALEMLALYRSGRQSDALEVYAATRAHLRDELGLDPGPALRELQGRILRHDAALATPLAAGSRPWRVPAAPNRLVGRARELDEVNVLLLRDDVRLLVLSGAGGSGKTRLALEAAHAAERSFANGAAFVGLAALRDPGLVAETIARSLGVHESAGRRPLETLVDALRDREVLLCVDNVEHLREAAPLFVELLALVPRLTLLVTSRVVLHVSGEHVYPVEPLGEADAVVLFEERAQQAGRPAADAGSAGTVEEIVRRLDGLPLALELAAGRMRPRRPRFGRDPRGAHRRCRRAPADESRTGATRAGRGERRLAAAAARHRRGERPAGRPRGNAPRRGRGAARVARAAAVRRRARPARPGSDPARGIARRRGPAGGVDGRPRAPARRGDRTRPWRPLTFSPAPVRKHRRPLYRR